MTNHLPTRSYSLLSIMVLAAPFLVQAADPIPAATNETPAAASPKPPKHHPRHAKTKKTPPPPPVIDQTAPPVDSHVVHPAPNTAAPGMSNSLGTNNPGAPNMGTGDHVPGSTGTSGQ